MLDKIHKSHFYACSATFFWSFAFIGTRVAIKQFSTYDLTFLRIAMASIIFIALLRIKGLRLPKLKDYPIFILSGLLGFALYFIVFNLGLKTLTAATACIIIATAPLITAIMASFIFKEKLPPVAWLSLLMALGGTAVLALWNGVFIFDAGIFWTLLGALSIGGYNIVQRQCSKNYTAIQITAYSFFSATILMIFFLPSATQSFVHAQAAQQLIVIGLAIFPSVIGYLSWAKALSIAEKTSTVVNYMYLTPFFALIFGILLLDEIPHAGILIGGAIILLALFIFNLALKRQKKLLESASKTFNVPEP